MQTEAPTSNSHENGVLETGNPALNSGTPSAEPFYSATLSQLTQYFGVEFSLFQGSTGDALQMAADAGQRDWSRHNELFRAVAERGTAELVEERTCTMTLAIPFFAEMQDSEGQESATRETFVAVADFRSIHAPHDAQAAAFAAELSMPEEAAVAWLGGRAAWDPEALSRFAELAVSKLGTLPRLEVMQQNVDDLSHNLAATYEEITLLYRLTENLRIGEDPALLWEATLKWLADVVPADVFSIRFDQSHLAEDEEPNLHDATLCIEGAAPVADEVLGGLTERFGRSCLEQPLVANCQSFDNESWSFEDLHQLVMVPIQTNERCFGYLLAANHADGSEFGTVEARFMSSVASILAIHCSNIELYREQAELMAGIVRALSSAIDAKDPYTCGHSDRVARFAVRIAEEMGLPLHERNTIYLSGLLHDVGKIGIADSVLRKPGRLTDAEYEHIKLHPSLGHKILKDIKKIEHILPGVLHHHEAYDGTGYPEGLTGENIPLQARIIAVADSFDAMGSDRPYRRGMESEKVDAILKQGSGQQWDSEVIDAFFRVRDDIRQLAERERDALRVDSNFWT